MKAPSSSPYRNLLTNAYSLQLLEGSFSGQSLSRKAGKSYGHVSNTIRAMLSSGYLSRTRRSSMLGSGGRSNLRGFSPSGYVLTKKGRSLIRVVLSGGVFDILHPGHVRFLSHAKALGDVLVVVIARDALVKRSKGRMPVSREEDRLLMVSSLRQADVVILGSENSYNDTLDRVSPDVVCLGYDQKADLEKVRRYIRETGKQTEMSIAPHLPGYSTSNILGRPARTR